MSEYCVHDYWLEGYAQGDKLILAAAPAIAASVASAVDKIKDVAAAPAISASASAAARIVHVHVHAAQVSKALTMTVTPSALRLTHPQVNQIDITTTPTANASLFSFIQSAGSAASSTTAAAGYTLPCAATTDLTSIMQSNVTYKWVNQAETSNQWVTQTETDEIWTVI
jgi:hypothetical protein